LPAQLLERIGQVLSALMREPYGSKKNSGADRDHAAPPISSLTLHITKRLFGTAGSRIISIRRS